MDSLYSSQKIPKFNQLNGAASPINTHQDHPLIRYLRAGPPLTPPPLAADMFSPSPSVSGGYQSSSSGSNKYNNSSSGSCGGGYARMSPVYGTPVQMMEEDNVLVVDGVLAKARVSRSGSSSSDSATAAASSAGSSVPKTELCVAWEDLGRCRFGSNCKFAHGKEELCPARLPIKIKPEAHSYKSYSTGSSSYGAKYRLSPDEAGSQIISPTRPEFPCMSPAFTITTDSSSSSKSINSGTTLDHLGRTTHIANKSPAASIRTADSRNVITTSSTISDYWYPLDDGIGISLLSHPDKHTSREDVHAYINNKLYDPSGRRRLPVFTEICPDSP